MRLAILLAAFRLFSANAIFTDDAQTSDGGVSSSLPCDPGTDGSGSCIFTNEEQFVTFTIKDLVGHADSAGHEFTALPEEVRNAIKGVYTPILSKFDPDDDSEEMTDRFTRFQSLMGAAHVIKTRVDVTATGTGSCEYDNSGPPVGAGLGECVGLWEYSHIVTGSQRCLSYDASEAYSQQNCLTTTIAGVSTPFSPFTEIQVTAAGSTASASVEKPSPMDFTTLRSFVNAGGYGWDGTTMTFDSALTNCATSKGTTDASPNPLDTANENCNGDLACHASDTPSFTGHHCIAYDDDGTFQNHRPRPGIPAPGAFLKDDGSGNNVDGYKDIMTTHPCAPEGSSGTIVNVLLTSDDAGDYCLYDETGKADSATTPLKIKTGGANPYVVNLQDSLWFAPIMVQAPRTTTDVSEVDVYIVTGSLLAHHLLMFGRVQSEEATGGAPADIGFTIDSNSYSYGYHYDVDTNTYVRPSCSTVPDPSGFTGNTEACEFGFIARTYYNGLQLATNGGSDLLDAATFRERYISSHVVTIEVSTDTLTAAAESTTSAVDEQIYVAIPQLECQNFGASTGPQVKLTSIVYGPTNPFQISINSIRIQHQSGPVVSFIQDSDISKCAATEGAGCVNVPSYVNNGENVAHVGLVADVSSGCANKITDLQGSVDCTTALQAVIDARNNEGDPFAISEYTITVTATISGISNPGGQAHQIELDCSIEGICDSLLRENGVALEALSQCTDDSAAGTGVTLTETTDIRATAMVAVVHPNLDNFGQQDFCQKVQDTQYCPSMLNDQCVDGDSKPCIASVQHTIDACGPVYSNGHVQGVRTVGSVGDPLISPQGALDVLGRGLGYAFFGAIAAPVDQPQQQGDASRQFIFPVAATLRYSQVSGSPVVLPLMGTMVDGVWQVSEDFWINKMDMPRGLYAYAKGIVETRSLSVTGNSDYVPPLAETDLVALYHGTHQEALAAAGCSVNEPSVAMHMPGAATDHCDEHPTVPGAKDYTKCGETDIQGVVSEGKLGSTSHGSTNPDTCNSGAALIVAFNDQRASHDTDGPLTPISSACGTTWPTSSPGQCNELSDLTGRTVCFNTDSVQPGNLAAVPPENKNPVPGDGCATVDDQETCNNSYEYYIDGNGNMNQDFGHLCAYDTDNSACDYYPSTCTITAVDDYKGCPFKAMEATMGDLDFTGVNVNPEDSFFEYFKKSLKDPDRDLTVASQVGVIVNSAFLAQNVIANTDWTFSVQYMHLANIDIEHLNAIYDGDARRLEEVDFENVTVTMTTQTAELTAKAAANESDTKPPVPLPTALRRMQAGPAQNTSGAAVVTANGSASALPCADRTAFMSGLFQQVCLCSADIDDGSAICAMSLVGNAGGEGDDSEDEVISVSVKSSTGGIVVVVLIVLCAVAVLAARMDRHEKELAKTYEQLIPAPKTVNVGA